MNEHHSFDLTGDPAKVNTGIICPAEGQIFCCLEIPSLGFNNHIIGIQARDLRDAGETPDAPVVLHTDDDDEIILFLGAQSSASADNRISIFCQGENE